MPLSNEDLISEQLDSLSRLMALVLLELTPNKTATEGIRLLKLAGLDNRTVAEILGVNPQVVRAISSKVKRVPSKKGRRAPNERP